jgi:hypothetical protein
MLLFFRILATVISGLAGFFFTFWLPGAFLFQLSGGLIWAFLLAGAGAYFCGKTAWLRTGTAPTGLFSAVVAGAIGLGSITFCLGFFGPLLLSPSANQGPLLGLLITGPLGIVVGGIVGAIYWRFRRE